MLMQFSVRNYKSFRDKVTFDMSATNIHEHPGNTFSTDFDEAFLKSSVIYGANAYGKSNFINALSFMKEKVLNQNSIETLSPIRFKDLTPYRFDDSRNKSSEFDIFFHYEGKDYQYGFILDEKKIDEEWLYCKDNIKEEYNEIFKRKDSDIELIDTIKNSLTVNFEIYENVLLLNALSPFKIDEIRKVIDWFLKLKILNVEKDIFDQWLYREQFAEKLKDEIYKANLLRMLRNVDIDIEDFLIKKDKISDVDNSISIILSMHKKKDNDSQQVPLLFEEESGGTRKLIILYNYIYDSFLNGTPLIVDELDSRLHPLLLRFIILMYHNPEINQNNGQLIYTAHDTFTLTREIFRRDQVWFVDKENQVSSLYSLVEYKDINDKKIRNDATYYKDYLLGKYNAIPRFKEKCKQD